MVPLVTWDSLANPDLTDPLDCPVSQDHLVLLGPLESLVPRDFLEKQVPLESLEETETRDRLECPVDKVQLVHQDTLVPWDRQEFKDLLGSVD